MSKFEMLGVDTVVRGCINGARTCKEADDLVEYLFACLGSAAILDMEVVQAWDEEGVWVHFEVLESDRTELERVLREYENE